MSASLPIHTVLPELLAALRERPSVVLVAPPGAGKTTAVAPALLAEPWCTGEVLLLSPRRIAARAAAERMAALADEPVGRTFGYATRLDSRRSPATRVTVLTEGIFRNRIQADPELSGVSAVLFDEIHERSLDSDVGLAFALDAQAALRPDLRVVAMSATLDGARVAALLGNAAVIESEGRSFPVEPRHLGRRSEERVEDAVVAAVRLALADGAGGVLAFLPGVAEIERTAERLDRLPADVVLHRLHGQIEPAAQRRAIGPSPAGTRKLVLATSIAETSLTLDGVTAVVDSGLARRARYDRAAGVTRLVTERVSRAAAAQRAGRAGRQAPGVAYRLWEEGATAGLPRFDPPEILEADLSALLLDCAIWGVADPAALRWLDPPPAAALTEARTRLAGLGALDADGRPTAHGRRVAELPLPPRLAHMLIEAALRGFGGIAAQVAVLLGERGLGGDDVDLAQRVARWRGERGSRAEVARGLARRWERLVGEPAAPATRLSDKEAVGAALALAFPDRLSRRRDPRGESWASAGGRGFRLDPLSHLARCEWLAVGETQGSAANARILSAAAIEPALIETLFAERIADVRSVTFDPQTGRAAASRERRLGALRLGGGADAAALPGEVRATLVDGVRRHGLGLLPWPDAALALQVRAAYALGEASPVTDDALLAALDDWLPALVDRRRSLGEVSGDALMAVMEARLGWDGRQRVERLAPSHFASPAGSRHPIDYAADGGPAVELRPQALFGLANHPTVGDRHVPLVLVLVSPAGRPIQVTRDLPGFWAGNWREVAKELRGRYPRHPWPDDPAAADPTLRTKKRGPHP